MKRWSRIFSNRLLWFALPVILGILAMALFAPWLAPYPPDAVDLGKKLL